MLCRLQPFSVLDFLSISEFDHQIGQNSIVSPSPFMASVSVPPVDHRDLLPLGSLQTNLLMQLRNSNNRSIPWVRYIDNRVKVLDLEVPPLSHYADAILSLLTVPVQG